MVELFEKTGILTMGSRLRLLAEAVTRDAAEIYNLYGIDIRPKWFPVLYMLYYGNDDTVTGIARSIGQSHPSVSTILREMKAAGLVDYEKNASDKRATRIFLTEKGKSLKSPIKCACDDVASVVTAIERDSEHKLWEAIGEWERQLADKPLFKRVAEEKQRKTGNRLEITDYHPRYHMTFKRLNIMWINSHWSLEAHDLEVLDNPETSILEHGGHILVALLDGEPIGVVALCHMDHPVYDFEIAKLAVDPSARGAGIGEALLRSAIERARSLGAKKLFLESNTVLRPAISLYRKLGFTELRDYHPAYMRGNIQMELSLN